MNILYEDNHIIIVNKKCSEIVQGDKTGDKPLLEELKDFIKARDDKPGNVFLGSPHRLDRPTSGIVIFAKTSKALSRLSEMFREQKIRKFYRAVVSGCPGKDKETLTHYLIRDTVKNKTKAYPLPKHGAQQAVLTYAVAGKTDRYCLLEIELHTGRHHQIRAQLAAEGCPIKGDLKYGFPRSNTNGGIYLHAWRVIFEHPVKKELLDITAPLPDNDPLWAAFPEKGVLV